MKEVHYSTRDGWGGKVSIYGKHPLFSIAELTLVCFDVVQTANN